MGILRAGQAASPVGSPAILPDMGHKSAKRRRKTRNGQRLRVPDIGNDRALLCRPDGRGAELERNLLDAGFIKPGGGVYIAAFIRFIHMLAPEYHSVDRKTVRRWLDGEDNAVAASLIRIVRIPHDDIKRMIYAACTWGGRNQY